MLLGSVAAMTAASVSVTPLAMWNTDRQPTAAPMNPLAVRDPRMPRRRPLITTPRACPRLAGAARWAANGTNICGVTENAPTKNIATAVTGSDGEVATATRLIEAPTSITRIRRRRSPMSPRGTKNSTPVAKPSCASVKTRPIADADTEKVLPMSARSGWM